MNVLAFIPARGGSKGLPGKNILPLAGKPLIAHSIESALRCSLITRVMVSTDDQAIADTALKHGADVPFLRPAHLAGDKADLGQVVRETLLRLSSEGYSPQVLVLLFPTSPLRTDALVRFLVERLIEGHTFVHTVKAFPAGAERFYSLGPKGAAVPLVFPPSPPMVRHYGLLSGNNTAGALPGWAHVIRDPAMLVDVDSREDFELAERLIASGRFDFQANSLGSGPCPPLEARRIPLAEFPARGSRLALAVGERVLRSPLTRQDQRPESEKSDRDGLNQALGCALRALERARNSALDSLEGRDESWPFLQALEDIAAQNPFEPDLQRRLQKALEAGTSPGGPTQADTALAALVAAPSALTGKGLDNLLVAAGLGAVRASMHEASAGLLAAVEWRRVARPDVALQDFYHIIGRSLALHRQALRMIEGLEDALAARLAHDPNLRQVYGVACGFCGFKTQAEKLLGPLLPTALPRPSEGISILVSLIRAGSFTLLRRFFGRKSRAFLRALPYDDSQRITLASLLFKAGLSAKAKALIEDMAARQQAAPDPIFPRIAHALVRVGGAGLVRTLTKRLDAPNVSLGRLDRLAALARSHLDLGRPAEARAVLGQLDPTDVATNPLAFDRFFHLCDQAADIDLMRDLAHAHFGPSPPVTERNYSYLVSMAHYDHDFPGLLDRALSTDASDDEAYMFTFWLHHNALWAGDTSTLIRTAERMETLGCAHPVNVHLLCGNAMLARNRLDEAAAALRARCAIIKNYAMDTEYLSDIWGPYFELALLLRMAGRPQEALAEVEACLSLENTPTNPCRALRVLLLAELGRSGLGPAQARALTRLGDAQMAERSHAGPWLHLQAALLLEKCDLPEQAARVTRTRLAKAPMLYAPARTELAKAAAEPGFRLADHARTVQAAFYPHLKGTYWNVLLQSDIEGR